MDLKSGYPYWAIKNGLLRAFPPLEQDLRCDVAIIGAGVTGALVAHDLVEHGHEVAVLDQRDVGWGSTCASTALLQYEIDTHMTDLAKAFGVANAALAYGSCVDAIDQIGDVARSLRDVEFQPMQSLYFASRPRHRKALERECQLRAQYGIDVTWLDAPSLLEFSGIHAPCAILSAKAARVDPYRLTYRLLGRLANQGAAIHDHTRVEALDVHPRHVELRTSNGAVIHCKHAVIAAGYESEGFLARPLAKNRSSYAFVTEPIPVEALGVLETTLVWESARPYIYLRTTGDHRLVAGGEDDDIDIPARRDARVAMKTGKLLRRLAALFPRLAPHLQPSFCWAGTFAETEDGLPYFGINSRYGKRVIFAMGYGGNGTVYSMLGAAIVRATIEAKPHPLAELFGFNR
ncbi:NAD(P)/FAD-dependent oxidoreductase [Solilutibacter silvestris]|nr:FAD-dependent oxidoreductase [Lysobacter silvestris]